jgi:hypothetical protein
MIPAVEELQVGTQDGVTDIIAEAVGTTYAVVNMHDPRNPNGQQWMALVEFENAPGPQSLFVTSAGWLSPVPYPVPLFMAYVDPTMSLDDIVAEAASGGVYVPSGDYSSNPLAIPVGFQGSFAVLLSTDCTTTFGPGFLDFSIDPPPAVPEPSSWVLMACAAAAVWLCSPASRAWFA